MSTADRAGAAGVGAARPVPRGAWVHVARLSVREAVNRKLVLAALLLSGAFLALYTTGMVLLARNEGGVMDAMAGSVLTSLGLYALYFLVAFLALTVAASAVAAEVDSGSLHALLARPLSRRAFLLGRWAALAGLLTAYTVGMGGAITLVSRVVAGHEPLSATRAIALIAFSAVLLVTLGLWWSTRLSAVATGVGLFCLFSIAWIAGFIELIGDVIGNATMTNLGIAVSLLIPSDALWRAASYYSQSPVALGQMREGIPLFGSTPPAPALLLWSGLYVLACLALALRTFRRRDL